MVIGLRSENLIFLIILTFLFEATSLPKNILILAQAKSVSTVPRIKVRYRSTRVLIARYRSATIIVRLFVMLSVFCVAVITIMTSLIYIVFLSYYLAWAQVQNKNYRNTRRHSSVGRLTSGERRVIFSLFSLRSVSTSTFYK